MCQTPHTHSIKSFGAREEISIIIKSTYLPQIRNLRYSIKGYKDEMLSKID